MLSLHGSCGLGQGLSFRTRLSSKKCLLQRDGWPKGLGATFSQFPAGRSDSWSLEGDLVMPIWTFPSFMPSTFYQEVPSVTWALWINKVVLYIDYSHERAQQLLWSHYNLLIEGSPGRAQGLTPALPGTGLQLLLGELPAFPSAQQQRWNKALHLFTVLSPCLQSALLIVRSLQLVKWVVKLFLEKKSLHMGSSCFRRQKSLIVVNILPPCTPEQKFVFRIYNKKLLQDLLVFKRHHFLLLSVCVFVCILTAKK